MRSLSASRRGCCTSFGSSKLSDAARLGLSLSARAAPATFVSCLVFFFAASDSQLSVMRRRYFACEGCAALWLKKHPTLLPGGTLHFSWAVSQRILF
jgi:hypothetical protein